MLQAVQRIRVEWAHCDPARIIFNPHYYIWMDQATHHLIAAAGYDFFALAGKGTARGCPLVASNLDFMSPAFLGDILELRSSVTRFGNTSFTVGHSFWRGDETLARGQEVRVWAVDHPDDSARMKAVALPDNLRDALSKAGTVDTTV